jgi:putative pyrroloquinoline-quinone binding quinoprotein
LPNNRRFDVKSLQVWRVQLRGVKIAILPSSTSRPNPVAVGNRLFVSLFSPGAIVCLNRENGAVVWRRRFTPFAGSHVLHAESLLYAESPHTLYCLDPENGRVVWRFCPYGTERETIYSAPAVKDGRLFVGDRRGFLHALDARNGRPLWRVLTSRARNNSVNGLPFVQGNQVFVATNAGRFLCMDVRTGSIEWNQYFGHPCINEILACPDAFVVATHVAMNWLDRQTGQLLARYPFSRGRIVRALVSNVRRVVVVLSYGRGRCEILGFRITDLTFNRQHDSIATLQWLPSGELVGRHFDGIGVLDPDTGERICEVAFQGECRAAQPAEQDGRLYALTTGGTVHALRWPPTRKAT